MPSISITTAAICIAPATSLIPRRLPAAPGWVWQATFNKPPDNAIFFARGALAAIHPIPGGERSLDLLWRHRLGGGNGEGFCRLWLKKILYTLIKAFDLRPSTKADERCCTECRIRPIAKYK
jgi:hypothetical protein